jgi:hypothetical protein
MHFQDYAQKRIKAILSEIERLKESEFPYSHSIDALMIIEKKI